VLGGAFSSDASDDPIESSIRNYRQLSTEILIAEEIGNPDAQNLCEPDHGGERWAALSVEDL